MTSVGEAVHARLRAMARRRGLNTSFLLTRWTMERYLARLSISPYRDRFLLKGAMLFGVWEGDLLRSTSDLDLHDLDESDAGSSPALLTKVAVEPIVQDDGLLFEINESRVSRLVGAAIPGHRLLIPVSLGSARLSLKIDICFGHAVTPGPELRWYSPMLPGYPAFMLACYPRETVVAEKLATAVEFGRDNSRLRDYFDLWFLIGRYVFEGHVLLEALEATFAGRDAGQLLIDERGFWTGAFSPDYATAARETSWSNWRRMHAPSIDALGLRETVAAVASFAIPLLTAARDYKSAPREWDPRTGWARPPRYGSPGRLGFRHSSATEASASPSKAPLAMGVPLGSPPSPLERNRTIQLRTPRSQRSS